MAHRAGGQREVPGAGVGERGEEHLQDPLETRREAGLQPRRGCRAFQGKRPASSSVNTARIEHDFQNKSMKIGV